MIQITLLPTSGGPTHDTFTDSRGEFFFEEVPAGGYEIMIRVDGYVPVRQMVEVINTVPVLVQPITLQPVSRNPSLNGSGIVSVQQLLIPEKARQEYSKGLKGAARGKTEDAVKHWKKSIQIFPQYAESYMQLSKVYANRGDFASAIDAAARAIDIRPKSPLPYEFLGYVYLREKNFPKAKEAFTTAVNLSDSRWLSQFWLGKLLQEEKNAQGAYPHLLRASQLNPHIPEIQIALYDDLLMLGRAKEALRKLDDFLVQFPGSPLAASLREKRERLAKAVEEEH
jgi:tetratricopeptide (TPR) repeat protein